GGSRSGPWGPVLGIRDVSRASRCRATTIGAPFCDPSSGMLWVPGWSRGRSTGVGAAWGAAAWGGGDPGDPLALAGGTPGGLERAGECAAEREGTRTAGGEHREEPT